MLATQPSHDGQHQIEDVDDDDDELRDEFEVLRDQQNIDLSFDRRLSRLESSNRARAGLERGL